MVGLTRFELVTPRLSSVCSNQLSYRPPLIYFSPLSTFRRACFTIPRHENLSKNRYRSGSLKTRQDVLAQLCRRSISRNGLSRSRRYPCQIDLQIPLRDSRKEVIQPQVLLQLPCYDFTPITDHTLGTCLPCGLAQLLLVQPAFVM